MKVGVLGAGAIGCFVGGRLVEAGHDVVFVGRLGAEVRAHGLTLTDYAGRRAALAPERLTYVEGPEALADVDVVLVTVKSAATEDAARPLAAILKRPTTVVSFQNGVSNKARLRDVLPGHPVLAGMVPFNVAAKGAGVFHNGTSGALAVESRDGLDAALVAALRDAGFAVERHPSLDALAWSKLLINLNNAVNALAGVPLYDQLRDRTYRRVMALTVREGMAAMRAHGLPIVRVGRVLPGVAACGLTLPDALFLPLMGVMAKVDPGARSSMLDDLERRRVTEVDYLNGEVLRLAEAKGVAAPVNRALIALVKEAERAGKGSPRIGAAELLRRVTGTS